MPDEVPTVTSCPLCLAPDEVQSMVTVEIDRRIWSDRIAIMICRSCAGAVIRAIRKLEPPLLTTEFWFNEALTDLERAAKAARAEREQIGAGEAVETQAESAEIHEGEEPDDGTSTD